MRVARERSAEAQPVGAGLFLDDAPRRRLDETRIIHGTRITRITHGTRISRITHGTRIMRIFRRSTSGLLHALEILQERGPEDASLHGDQPALGVERQHPIERARIDEHAGLAELLAAHRMPSARDRYGFPFVSGISHCRRQLADVARGDNRVDARRVQLRMDIVDEGARDLVLGAGERW